uniref:Uncharacterized protein n=1 Tax=Tetranychus urticae TaxID=32264 RepID=T1KX31_TETUR
MIQIPMGKLFPCPVQVDGDLNFKQHGP